jgi:Leucine-rich repeat (LRR) protein
LQYLDLQGNKILELPGLRPVNLVHVDLSHNEIKRIEGFTGHAKLEYLDLGNNQIVDISNLG